MKVCVPTHIYIIATPYSHIQSINFQYDESDKLLDFIRFLRVPERRTSRESMQPSLGRRPLSTQPPSLLLQHRD
ncbi:Hypothetical protein FKW44_014841 [Caligus rogercresseyi]|uniref:Uncharacterized protein n=1 Tax=Caligus rogercresseyi TaxID=217165 RepID=A0A7T8JZA5_CALRO|nr:Hypothetical protein FKW44_014841 [Caligus rogercresseyi]